MNSRYKTTSHAYDPFHGTGAQARAQQHSSGLQNGYADDVMEIGYKTGGWDFGFQVNWEDSTNNTGTGGGGFRGGNGPVDAGSWNGSIKYKQNNWEASFAYFDTDYGDGSGDMDGWKIGAKWKGNGWSVAGQYEDLDASNAVNGTQRPDGTANGMLGFNPTGANTGNADFETFLVAVTYDVSDSTTLMGRYGQGDLDENIGPGDQEVGYMDNEYDAKGAADRDVDAWIAGMIHKF